MRKNRRLWKLLMDLNIFLTGAAATKWYILGSDYFFLYPLSAALLMVVNQLEISVENGYIRTILRGQNSYQ